MKVYILLAIIGAVYCNTNHDITDEIFENTVLKYEFLGNGIQQSEQMAEIMIECVIQGRATIPTRIWKDFVGLCWPYIQLRLTAIVRAVIMPDLLFLAVGDHFSTYCKRDSYHQIKFAQITNSKLAESKQLRDRFIGYLTEMFNENRVQAEDLSQIICVARKYFRDVIDLHPDEDGFRDYARERQLFFTGQYERLEEMYKVRAAPQCEPMKESYPPGQFKTYMLALSKILMKSPVKFISPEIYLKKAISMDPGQLAALPFMLPITDPAAYVPLPDSKLTKPITDLAHNLPIWDKAFGGGGGGSPLSSIPFLGGGGDKGGSPMSSIPFLGGGGGGDKGSSPLSSIPFLGGGGGGDKGSGGSPLSSIPFFGGGGGGSPLSSIPGMGGGSSPLSSIPGMGGGSSPLSSIPGMSGGSPLSAIPGMSGGKSPLSSIPGMSGGSPFSFIPGMGGGSPSSGKSSDSDSSTRESYSDSRYRGSQSDSPSNRYNPDSQSRGYNPDSQSRGYNPDSQSRGYNPDSQSRGYNPDSQSRGYNPDSQSRGYNPDSQSRGYNSDSQSKGYDSESRDRRHRYPKDDDRVGRYDSYKEVKDSRYGSSARTPDYDQSPKISDLMRYNSANNYNTDRVETHRHDNYKQHEQHNQHNRHNQHESARPTNYAAASNNAANNEAANNAQQ